MSTQQLHEYVPPKWASPLKNIPKHFVKLAQRDTPIHSWHIPNLPKEFSLFIKRDDLTGCALSGNKARKLEFVLADALDKKCDTVFTCGRLYSNHCRTTAVAARQLGLECYLIQRSPEQTTDIGCKGNILLNRMVGSHVILVPDIDYDCGPTQMMYKLADKLKQQGSNPYVIQLGDSSYIGTFGYLTAFQEMINQNVLKDFDDIVLTGGTGGTASGIAIANYLTGSKLKCHAVTVSFNGAMIYEKVNKDLREAGLDVQAEDILDVIVGYQGQGYGKPSEEDLETILEISSTTGILLDQVYNIRAVTGMLAEMKTNPGRFKGRRILYIHTGGVFGLFDGKMDPIITNPQSVKSAGQVLCWGDINDPPPC
ncbi:hypothetical protein ACROYT_G029177 [Oculina patagonica]